MSDYIEINKNAWNLKTEIHIESDFYENEAFLNGKNSLKEIELNLLGDIKGKSILHLQCHFGQDSISLSRMGAKVTGIDLSDKAIEKAKEFAQQANVDTQFISCDIFDLPNYLDKQYDIVFTSYGTIGWLPDLDKCEVLNNLIKHNIEINSFDEYNYSPYNCFNHTVKIDTDKYQIDVLGDKIPMTFSIVGTKK